MKILQKLFLVLGTATVLTGVARGESETQLLTEAQAAYLRGDLEAAKRNFELVNRLDPRNATAIGYLRLIRAKEAKGGGGAKLEKQLQSVTLPQVRFEQATLGSALDFLKQQVSKLTEGKMAVNFVMQVPEATVKTTQVTLNLTNVPFTEVLRYIGTLANVTFSYEQYAIAVKPKAMAANTPSTAQ